MARRFITFEDNKIGYDCTALSYQNIVVRESTPIDEFYQEKTISKDDSRECIAFVDPIRMLFNQQRLAKIGSSQVDAWLDSLSKHKNDPLSELRSKCTDSELKYLIKSRHIQQPSEIVAYARQMSSDMEFFNSELKKLAEASNIINPQTTSSDVVEPSVNDSSSSNNT